MTREEWLEARKNGIGGSDAATILGLNPYKTTIELWEEKTGKREAEDIIWRANGYIFRECECGTKMKFPLSYKGQEINCPHCGRIIKAEE